MKSSAANNSLGKQARVSKTLSCVNGFTFRQSKLEENIIPTFFLVLLILLSILEEMSQSNS